MPPKAAQKVKAEEKPPATPEKQKAKPKAETPSKPKTPSKTPKRAASEAPVEFTRLDKDTSGGALIPVDVKYEGSFQAKQRNKGGYGKLIQLEAPNGFSIVKTTMFTEGDYAGHQAIILRPAKPFEFMRLSPEARNRIYTFYFASKGVVGDSVVFDGKRSETKEGYAKSYADGSKERVALLAVSKEVHEEARQIFYSLPLKFDTTSSVVDFFTSAEPSLRQSVTNIEIKTFQRTSSRNALHLLAEAKSLRRLHFDSGVFNEGDPIKAAKTFYQDAFKFLNSMTAIREAKHLKAQAMKSETPEGSVASEDKPNFKTAGVDILSFGRAAFTLKDTSKSGDKAATKNWAPSMVEEFKEALRGKLTGK